MKRLLVVGAAGDVGQGIVRAAADRGWRVVAAGRDASRLFALAASVPGGEVLTAPGSLATESEALALWEAAAGLAGGVDAVAVAVNAPNVSRALADWTPAELAGVFETNLLTHFIAARAFLPRLPKDGVFVGVGGGTADFVLPQGGHLSMVQAALRMMYRALAKEHADGPAVRELLIASMVNGQSKRPVADPAWVTDLDVGRHLCAIVEAPEDFPGPVVTLRSRDGVGRPEGPTIKPMRTTAIDPDGSVHLGPRHKA